MIVYFDIKIKQFFRIIFPYSIFSKKSVKSLDFKVWGMV